MSERLMRHIPAEELGKGMPIVTACQLCPWQDRWEDWGVGYRAASASRVGRHFEEKHPKEHPLTRTTEAAAPADETIEIEEPLSAEAIAELQAAFARIYESASPIRHMPLVAIEAEIDLAMTTRFGPDAFSFEVPRAFVSKLSPFKRYRHVSGADTDFGVTCAREECRCRAEVRAVLAAP